MAQYEKLINLSLLNQFLTKAKTIFAPKITASGILKGDGAGNVSAATAGTDYGTYSKPSTGIPKTDLASDVQTSLGKADTALQQHQSLAAYRTAAAQDVIDAGKEASGLGLTGASVGDLVRVNSVDSNGKPTSWKHVPLNEIKCNKNLLDNWYFVGGGSQLGDGVFPINQRGQTTYSGAGYGIDRWKQNNGNSMTLVNGGIVMESILPTSRGFNQVVSNANNFAGKTVTLSVLITELDHTIVFGIQPGGIILNPDKPGLYSATVTLDSDLSSLQVNGNAGDQGKTVTIAAVKLELGSEQTLAHNEGTEENPVWVLNEIPDYWVELRKCQRYFYSTNRAITYSTFGTGMATDSNTCVFPICLPNEMRSAYTTVTFHGIFYTLPGYVEIPTLTCTQVNGNIAKIGAIKTNAFTAGQVVQLVSKYNNSYITFSADL